MPSQTHRTVLEVNGEVIFDKMLSDEKIEWWLPYLKARGRTYGDCWAIFVNRPSKGNSFKSDLVSKANKEKIKSELLEGKVTMHQICQRYKITWRYLKNFLAKEEITYEQKQVLTDEQAEEIRILFEDGLTNQSELARRYNVSRKSIWRVLKNKCHI